MSNETEALAKRIYFLLCLNFCVGFLFDFGSTVYSYSFRTPLFYPNVGDVSLLVWLALSFVLFLNMLMLVSENKIPKWVIALLFIFVVGTVIQLINNSIQVKLYILGYQDELSKGNPQAVHAALNDPRLVAIFSLIYFYDEILGHFLAVGSYFFLFIKLYDYAFIRGQQTAAVALPRRFWLPIGGNGLYLAWLVIEGQSTPLFVLLLLSVLGIKYYHRSRGHPIQTWGKIIEYFTWVAMIILFCWFVLVGHGERIPEFFITLCSWWNLPCCNGCS